MEHNTSRYIFLSSDHSTEYFPQNCVTDFKIKLKTALTLDEHWYVALCDVRFGIKSADTSNSLTIFCDLCKHSFINEYSEPILRRIGRKESRQFSDKQYFPVVQRYIERIHIYILNEKGQTPLVSNRPLELTLHLKRALNHHFL